MQARGPSGPRERSTPALRGGGRPAAPLSSPVRLDPAARWGRNRGHEVPAAFLRGPLRLLYQRDDVAEMGMLGRAEPFESNHFGRDDLGAVPCQARNRRLLAFRAARADRIAHQIDAPSGI